ncbi:MAG: putative methyltransferase [Kiritimatiellia bacterium]|jgi:predicted methyltransferase
MAYTPPANDGGPVRRLLLLCSLAACTGTPITQTLPPAPEETTAAPAPPTDLLKEVVGAADRHPDDRAKDVIRKPLELLRFGRLRPGQRVAEVGAAGGYTTELLSRSVGAQGKVYSQNPESWREWSVEPWNTRIGHHAMPNVTRVQLPMEAPLPDDASDLDAIFSVLIYHDVVNMPTDRAAMNAAIFAHLKPGGNYIVIDHQAAEGAGVTVTETLHRIERDTVEQEVLAAGFELVGGSTAWVHHEDAHDTLSVGDPQPVTDRYALKFRRPDL